MPDALVIASAMMSDIDIVVTNDRAWANAAAAVVPSIQICSLDR